MRAAPGPAAAQPQALTPPRLPIHLLRYSVDSDSGCWLWGGRLDRKGYGRVYYRGRSYAAHRAVYLRLAGPIPSGYVLDHVCRNTSCVRPDHLEPVTTQVNIARGRTPTSERARARLTGSCINGHAIALVGVHKQGRGFTCAECGRDRVRRYKLRKRARALGISA